MVFQGSLIGVSLKYHESIIDKKFQGCFKKVSSGCQRCLKEVQWVFQRFFKEVSRLFQENLKGTLKKMEGCFNED